MGRNNADFQGGLFHGTNHPFKVGDIVKPTPEAYATTDPERAWSYAQSRSGWHLGYDSPENTRVYSVEPLDADEADEATSKFYGMDNTVVSHKGFRVTGLVRQGTEIVDDGSRFGRLKFRDRRTAKSG